MSVRGKRVLITGASRGIGKGLAEGFAREGAHLALVARSEGPLAELAKALGGTAYTADLLDPTAVDGLIDRVEADGPIDVLINNAGISHVKYVLDNTAEEIEAVFRTNVLTPIHLCRQVIPRMVERGGGHIVNVSSLAAVMVPPGLVHYSASKAALSHYTAGLRQDLRGLPIDTTLVEIGSVPTELDDLSRNHGPLRTMVERQKKSRFARDQLIPLPTLVDAVIDAVKRRRRHVRLPRPAAPLCMLVEAPRRLMEFAFRDIDPRS